MLPIDRIYCGNNLDLIEEVSDNSIDLVFYSPPYFDTHRYGESSKEIGHGQDLRQYLESMAQLNRACARVLKPTGNLVINVMDLVREGRPLPLADWLIDDVATRLDRDCNAVTVASDDAPFHLIQKIIWFIVNKMPVASDRRFCNKFEWILHLAKDPADYYFNLDAVRAPHGKWGAIDAKKRPEKWNPLGKNPGNDWSFAAPSEEGDIQAGQRDVPDGDHWDIKAYRVGGKRKFHKAGFPIELCDRVIQAWCPAGGVMLDPFVGSGTSCLSARELGRHFIGFELFPANVEICEKRLSGELV